MTIFNKVDNVMTSQNAKHVGDFNVWNVNNSCMYNSLNLKNFLAEHDLFGKNVIVVVGRIGRTAHSETVCHVYTHDGGFDTTELGGLGRTYYCLEMLNFKDYARRKGLTYHA